MRPARPAFRESCIVDLAKRNFDSRKVPGEGHRASRMRAFPFRSRGRLLRVVVVPAREAWQLWVCEEERRLAYGGRVSVDEAIAGWRIGDDRVLELAEEVKSNVLTGKLALDDASTGFSHAALADGEDLPLPPDPRASRSDDA
jgi:hypothetical protein